MNNQKPFSKEYVLRTTRRHMLHSVDTSIQKTFVRSQEFSDNPEKSTEVFKTLGELHNMRQGILNAGPI